MLGKIMLALSPAGAARAYGLRIVSELKRQGQEVYVFDFGKWSDLIEASLLPSAVEYAQDFLGQAFLTKLVDEMPRALVVLPLCPVNVYYLRLAKKLGIRCIHWFYEDWRAVDYWRDVAGEYDVFLTVQKGSFLPYLQKSGIGAYLPTGVDRECMPSAIPLVSRRYDFVFVGVASEYRQRILSFLLACSYRVCVAGEGWNSENLPGAEVLEFDWLPEDRAWALYQESVFGLALSVQCPSENGGVSEQQLSPRVYEMVASNCIPVFENLDLVASELEDIEKVVFTSEMDLKSQLDQIDLQKWDTQNLQQNQLKVRREHSLELRIRALIAQTMPNCAEMHH